MQLSAGFLLTPSSARDKNQGTWLATRYNLCDFSSWIMPPKRGAKENVGDARNDHVKKK
jgi:hypothetical protein